MKPDVTVLCWVGPRHGDIDRIHRAYADVLDRTGRTAEFLYVMDGPRPRGEEQIARIVPSSNPLRVLRMAKGFGEAAALQLGFDRARGRIVLTVPDRFQADPAIVPVLLDRVDDGADVAVARRTSGGTALAHRAQFHLWHVLARRIGRRPFGDLSSGLRAIRADVARKLDLYGDLHRFLPLLASRAGFAVLEVTARRHPDDRGTGLAGPGVYARRLLDLLNVFFLTRFTRKPLRFFGLIGMTLAGAGGVVGLVIVAQRFLADRPLAERPMLLLAVLLVVLGVQLASLGLVGEIVLFLSSRRDVPEVVELDPAELPEPDPVPARPRRTSPQPSS